MTLREVNRVGEGQKNVPKLRFKGYEDAWEQRKLGEEVQIVMGQSPKGENYTDNPEDYILVQGNADMKDGKVFPRVWTTQVTKQAHKGDIILSVRAPVGDIGKTNYDVVIGRGVAAVKGNEFFYQLLGKLKLDGYWTKSSTGSTFDSINSNEIKNAKVTIPDTNEQLFIGDYFQGLDNLITLHQRKYDALKTMKKTLLSKMFPKDGEDVPEIRFKGFTDAWEQRKLGEVFEQTVEYVNPKLENIELWSVTVESGLTPKTERYNREALVKKEDKFKLVHPGDVVYNPMNMTIGAVGMNQHSDSIAVSGYYVTMRLRENFNGFYFFEWMSSDRAMNLFRNHATGSLIEKQRVQFPTLSNISAYVPEFFEQKDIGHFFQRLDKLITLHQRKLDELKNIKKTLLQQMFV